MIKKSFMELELSNSIKKLETLQSKLPEKPNGKLKSRTYKSGNTSIYHQYYDSSNRLRRITLDPSKSKDVKIIEKFKIFYITSNNIKLTKQYILSLKKFIEDYPISTHNNIINVLGTSSFENSKFISTKNSLWNNLKDRQNNSFMSNLKFNGHNGLYRSKSEASISKALFENNIPYKYETQLITPSKTIYPDFVILSPLKDNVIIWEHLGMMGDLKYNKKAKDKINLYESIGYYINKNLIITYETLNAPFTEEDSNYIINLISYL